MEKPALYRLPFDTSIHPLRISQGHNGPWSHMLQRRVTPLGNTLETDLLHAVDFALPLGTEVRAARDGKIFLFMFGGTWYYEGSDPEIGNNPPPDKGWTNQLLVDHGDETFALYSHLANEFLVTRGQPVRAGDVIARTGRSGWIGNTPHVHLMVLDRTFRKTLLISFSDYDGPLDHQTLLRQGKIWDPA